MNLYVKNNTENKMLMKKYKLFFVMGARPNFMKIAPLIEWYRNHNDIQSCCEIKLIHTGQHYDHTMSTSFLQNLNLEQIDYHLEVGTGTHAVQTGKIMIEFEQICQIEKPDIVVVVGDVNSTLACAVAAKKLHCQVCHIEAGLRSFNRKMPEEINRLVTDSITDLFLTTCAGADAQLKKENVPDDKIACVGNLMIDTLLRTMERTAPAEMTQLLVQHKLKDNDFILLTLHRPENVDDKKRLKHILTSLKKLSAKNRILFPCHPRTEKNIKAYNYDSFFSSRFIRTKPLDYFTMVHLYNKVKFVLTDSGGMQEETTALGIPCLTLRDETERPITVDVGSNTIVGANTDKLLNMAKKICDGNYRCGSVPPLWDGLAAERVWKELLRFLSIKE